MSEPRTLVVTVGTSLFSSASWKCKGKFASVRGYRSWTEDYLEKPADRRAKGWNTAEKIEELLAEGTEATTDHFELAVDRPLRYSGELTTLLRCFQRFAASGESFEAFLRRSYKKIDLLASTDVSNPSNIAARHLQVILSEKLGHPETGMPGSLRSPYLQELVQHLQRHLALLTTSGTEVDLLVTGGYKAFSILAGKFVATQPESRAWRALYVHEDDVGQLIVEGRGETWIGNDKVALTRWPSPVGED